MNKILILALAILSFFANAANNECNPVYVDTQTYGFSSKDVYSDFYTLRGKPKRVFSEQLFIDKEIDYQVFFPGTKYCHEEYSIVNRRALLREYDGDVPYWVPLFTVKVAKNEPPQ